MCLPEHQFTHPTLDFSTIYISRLSVPKLCIFIPADFLLLILDVGCKGRLAATVTLWLC